jgi:metal-responsive CopG/Arc/MetJ family transcriptional regulator
MSEQITVRVPDGLTAKLEYAAQLAGVRKSDIAREALEEYLTSSERISDARPIDKVRGLIGSVSSGVPDLGEKHREHLIERLTRSDA